MVCVVVRGDVGAVKAATDAGAVAAEVLEQSMWSCARCVSAKHATHSHEHLREHGAIWRERAHGEGERR